ncbi:unnamed protein product [Discosporangium mesarthrocarpum]
MVGEGWIQLVIALCFLLALRVWAILPYRRRRQGSWDPLLRSQERPLERKIKTLVVLGSGGHTSEMLKLTAGLSPKVYTPMCYVVAKTDHTSIHRIPPEHLESGRCWMATIPRSREVGQSWPSTFVTTLWSGAFSVALVMKVRPDLILVNGPGTCIPICLAGFALRIIPGWGGKIIFCESFCRVKTLSMTGKIMYPIADRFLVHWPELLEVYPLSEYIGQLL